MAPQSAPHRRGGTHRVRDENKTNTKYDDYDYKLLKSTCIERGIYVKDMKKVEMAKTLARNDIAKRTAEREATVAQARQQKLLEKEKQREEKRKQEEDALRKQKRLAKAAMRERDESVSDDTPDEDEIQQMHNMMIEDDDGPAGQALSEESWDSSSTETTFYSTNPKILPECKLRLFEWAFTEMPSPTARFPPSSDFDRSIPYSPTSPPARSYVPGKRPLPVPRNIEYAPLKVHTTQSQEKLFFPGLTYPPGVEPDYVPILSKRTRHAARNGILEGVLRKATIEPATAWTDRTQIQGWNARMFYSLPPRNEAKKLPAVYNKWFLENRKLLRVEPRGNGLKVTRQQRHAQRHKNKAKKLIDVLEASEHRPTAVCYLPAYLDFEEDTAKVDRKLQDQERTLENLFFIRFPGCDVPHYYFWTREGGWIDPTTPNPQWIPSMAEFDTTGDEDEVERFERPRMSQKRVPGVIPPVRKILTRFKSPYNQPPPPARSAAGRTLDTVVFLMEYELYTYGLTMTLIKYRTRWLAKGKESAWKAFGQFLPLLFPSGTLPLVPPVDADGQTSIAMKLASIEMIGERTQLPPLQGNEPWTKDDDAYWDVEEVQEEVDDTAAGPGDVADDLDMIDPNELEALYRRGSVPALSLTGTDKCAAWLEHVSPSFGPLTSESLSASPSRDDVDTIFREQWESKFLQDKQSGMDVTCPFCLLGLGAMTSEKQARHMYSHSVSSHSNLRRASSIASPLVALPSAGRRPSCCVNTNLQPADAGAEGDTEKTPIFQRRQSNLHVNTRPTRPSVQICNVAGMPSTPNCSRIDRLELLTHVENENALARRSSKMADPSYLPTKDEPKKRKSNNDHSVAAQKKKKRKKIADPTYRAARVSSSDEEMLPIIDDELVKGNVPMVKKRKRIADPTYRDKSALEESLSEVEEVGRARKKSKRPARPVRSSAPSPEGSTSAAVLDSERGEVSVVGASGSGQGMPTADLSHTDKPAEYGNNATERPAPKVQDEKNFVWERDWCALM